MSDPVADLIAAGPRPKELPDGSPHPTLFPGGVVGIVASDLSRFSWFNMSLAHVVRTMPNGSTLAYTHSVDVSGNCNEIIRSMKDEHDWVWIMGDDHVFGHQQLLHLLQSLYSVEDCHVVVPYCYKRSAPWMPVVYSHQNDDGWWVAADVPTTGLHKIHAAGSAGMLIRREVLETLEDPWFQPEPGAAGLNEDLYFCQKVRDAGFTIYCNSDVRLGHIGLHTVMPTVDKQGRWEVSFVMDNRMAITSPSMVAEARRQEFAEQKAKRGKART